MNLIVKFPLKNLSGGLTLKQLKFSWALWIYTFYLCTFITCFWPCAVCQPSSQKSPLTSLLCSPRPITGTALALPRWHWPILDKLWCQYWACPKSGHGVVTACSLCPSQMAGSHCKFLAVEGEIKLVLYKAVLVWKKENRII